MPLPDVRPGMVLAKSIVGDQGDLLLAAGFVVNERVLEKMQDLGLNACWIFEEGTEAVMPEEAVNEQLALQARTTLKENADLLREALDVGEVTLENVEKALNTGAHFHNIVPVDKFKNVVREILEALMKQEPVTVNLNSLRTKSGYLYQHSLDVSITAIIVAQTLKYSKREIEELALGCLLMDTGLVLLGDALLAKTGPLTEAERNLYQGHTTLGYAILRKNEHIPLTSAHVAFQHHERQDGKGFPRRLTGDNRLPLRNLAVEKGRIHRYAEIAATADAYVSMIAPRPGTLAALAPNEAVKNLLLAAGTRLNQAVVHTLVRLIPIYPVGSKVVVIRDQVRRRLVGYTGVVAKYRTEQPGRPLILLLYDRDRRKLTKPMPLDLLEDYGIGIQYAVG